MEENMDDGLCDHKASMMAVLHAGPGIMLLTASMQLLDEGSTGMGTVPANYSLPGPKRANGVLPSVSRVSSMKSGRPSSPNRSQRLGADSSQTLREHPPQLLASVWHGFD